MDDDAKEDQPAPTEEKESAIDEKLDELKLDEASPSETPSLAQQSKIRSTSFRAGSMSGALASPGPFSPDGDTAPDIYRKHVARIEELEKDNRRLQKESEDAQKRWKKAEDELADLREADSGETKDAGETETLVSGQHLQATWQTLT